MNLQDRVVVITGATGSLGHATAVAFAAVGARCALMARDADKLRRLYGEDRPDRIVFAADLAEQDALDRVARDVAEKFGRIDALCNIAGGFTMGHPVHRTPEELWRRMIDLNATSVLRMAHAVVPHMIAAGQGRIVNVAAAGALRGAADMGAYAAAKSAVIRLTESMSAELRHKNINVNCVLPSIIDTPANRADMPNADPARWVAPGALADVMLFLVSDAARAVHGAALPVVGLS